MWDGARVRGGWEEDSHAYYGQGKSELPDNDKKTLSSIWVQIKDLLVPFPALYVLISGTFLHSCPECRNDVCVCPLCVLLWCVATFSARAWRSPNSSCLLCGSLTFWFPPFCSPTFTSGLLVPLSDKYISFGQMCSSALYHNTSNLKKEQKKNVSTK
jgi:hypothetical protein